MRLLRSRPAFSTTAIVTLALGIGGAMGLGTASWISGGVLALLPPDLAVAVPNLRFDLNPGVLAFAVALSCAICLLFGVAPAIRAAGQTVAVDLRAGGGGVRPGRWTVRADGRDTHRAARDSNER